MRFCPIAVITFIVASIGCQGQVVDVTLIADTNRIPVGGSTVLRAYAQIIEPLREGADRIFSWYVDFHSPGESVAKADYSLLQKPEADKDPLISSTGTTVGAGRIGIYDTFMNREGAGKTTSVLLFTVPVKGISVGEIEYAVAAGSGVQALSDDFMVAPLGGGDALTGGVYANASVVVEVFAGASTLDPFPISFTRTATKNVYSLTWPVKAGWRYSLEYRNDLKAATIWQPMASVVLASGSATLTNTVGAQFFRIKAEPQ